MPKMPAFQDWTPPWGEDDEKLDPTKVKKLIYNLHVDKETLQGKVADVTTERDGLKTKVEEHESKDLSENEKLKREIEKLKDKAPKGDDLAVERLRLALRHGFTESQAARLVGSTADELEADAKVLARDLGIKGKSKSRQGDDGDNDGDDDHEDNGLPIPRGGRRGRSGFERGDREETYDPAELQKTLPRR